MTVSRLIDILKHYERSLFVHGHVSMAALIDTDDFDDGLRGRPPGPKPGCGHGRHHPGQGGRQISWREG